MKKLFLLLVLLTINNISARIFVSPNSFVCQLNKFINITNQTDLTHTQPENYKITVNKFLDFKNDKNIFIHHKQNNTYHYVKNGICEISMPVRNNNSMFEIAFLEKKHIHLDDIDITQNNSTQTLTISNPKALNIETVDLFDILGKLVLNNSKVGPKTTYKISTNGIAEGIYIVKVVFENGNSETKKIEIFKAK